MLRLEVYATCVLCASTGPTRMRRKEAGMVGEVIPDEEMPS